MKGMEAMGALRHVMGLFNTLDVYVCKYVMDDDTLTKTTLKHAYKTLLDAGLFNMADWPRYKEGKRRRTGVSFQFYIQSLHSLQIAITEYEPVPRHTFFWPTCPRRRVNADLVMPRD